MSKKVYWVRQSVDDEDERPDGVTYYDPSGWFKTGEGYKEFQANACVSAGDAGYPAERWFVPDLYASRKGKTAIEDWDYYMCSGTFGAFSQRAMDVLTPYFGDLFLSLPARLEGHPYYCLHCRTRIDCLNRAASEITYFEHDPRQVMMISKYVFRKEQLADRMIFAIPEMVFHLFCSDWIPEVAGKAGLRGFDFQLVDEGAS
jgi:hypothetical protein